jgi:Fur family zinc uptake transcriptional regulator/Fur family ferric uptake transcriptional regulator
MNAEFQRSLRHLNLKVTPKRIAIIEILTGASGYLSPEEIWSEMKRRFNRIGLPTVYRILEELAEGNMISKITHPNRQLYYFFCGNKEHHHHFVCLSCRNVNDIDFCAIHELRKEVRRKLNGQVVSHILQVNGLCEACLKKQGKELLA